jgi:hypothetical protein
MWDGGEGYVLLARSFIISKYGLESGGGDDDDDGDE